MRFLTAGIAAVFSIGLTLSQASAQENGNFKEVTAPRSVAGTAAGMPPTAQVMWAVVNVNGQLVRGFPAPIQTLKGGAGVYQVVFSGRNVAGCAYNATLGNGSTATIAAGTIQVALGAGTNSQGVFVGTTATNGAPTNKPFHLIVTC